MSKNTCPICNEVFERTLAVCPRCGFKMVGNTQVFVPVNDSDSDLEPLHLPDIPKSRSLSPALKVTEGPNAGEMFYLDQPSVSLGRDPRCDIFLNDMTVSREHAIISLSPGRVMLKDCGSLNGTWVDGEVVEEVPLVDGTLVNIGTFRLLYVENPEA